MCGIVGISNLSQNLSNQHEIINKMSITLEKRGPDYNKTYFEPNVILNQRKLITKNCNTQNELMKKSIGDTTFVIVYNGELYNTNKLKKELSELGYKFNSYSDTELILVAFIEWGKDCVSKLDGVFSFAIWNSKNKELFLARDRLGVKPLFYSIKSGTLIFGSEIKAVLAHPLVSSSIDEIGLSEIFGLGPAKTCGNAIFKDINELKPGYFLIFNEYGIKTKKYWTLKACKHEDNFDDTVCKIQSLIKNSIENQLKSKAPLCTFLSGGLDSSIVTYFTASYYKEHNLGTLDTYSVDYVDNDKNFVKSDFQPNSDNYYIKLMSEYLGTNHHNIVIDTPELAEALDDAVYARDLPGMADVDSSLLVFSREVKKNAIIALTGECADEVFGGYPWFYRDDTLQANTFPWSLAIDERQNILNPTLKKKLNLKKYVDYRYNESINEAPLLDGESEKEQKIRKMFYLNFYWFMQTLIDRNDRMCMYNSFEAKVPFCDYKIFEYVFNIPWDMKSYKGREKGLLRYCVKDILPKEIVERKKSPYPKTHNPNYLSCVKTILSDILNNNSSPILNLIDKNVVWDIVKTDGKSFKRPWFGQLMTGPQLMAYLIQLNTWLYNYKPEIII